MGRLFEYQLELEKYLLHLRFVHCYLFKTFHWQVHSTRSYVQYMYISKNYVQSRQK